MSVVDAGLAAEFAVIYAYGTAAVHLPGEARRVAEELDAEHRDRRDALLDFYDAHDLEATPAEPGYDVGAVDDAESAQALLLELEQQLATTWRAGVASQEPSEREICLNMLTDCAKALARWRLAIGDPVADAWPGRPALGPVYGPAQALDDPASEHILDMRYSVSPTGL